MSDDEKCIICHEQDWDYIRNIDGYGDNVKICYACLQDCEPAEDGGEA